MQVPWRDAARHAARLFGWQFCLFGQRMSGFSVESYISAVCSLRPFLTPTLCFVHPIHLVHRCDVVFGDKACLMIEPLGVLDTVQVGER